MFDCVCCVAAVGASTQEQTSRGPSGGQQTHQEHGQTGQSTWSVCGQTLKITDRLMLSSQSLTLCTRCLCVLYVICPILF